jgi:hypothetical protein
MSVNRFLRNAAGWLANGIQHSRGRGFDFPWLHHNKINCLSKFLSFEGGNLPRKVSLGRPWEDRNHRWDGVVFKSGRRIRSPAQTFVSAVLEVGEVGAEHIRHRFGIGVDLRRVRRVSEKRCPTWLSVVVIRSPANLRVDSDASERASRMKTWTVRVPDSLAAFASGASR